MEGEKPLWEPVSLRLLSAAQSYDFVWLMAMEVGSFSRHNLVGLVRWEEGSSVWWW